MRLLICTQILDANDPVLGFFHRWIEEFAAHADHIQVICLKEGVHHLPGNVSVHSLGKESGVAKLGYLVRFYMYAWKYRRKYDAVFVHMNPEYVILGGIPWRLMGKRIGLWYTHRSVNPRLRLATLFAHTVFTASPESFRLRTSKVQIVGHGIVGADCQALGRDARLVSVGRISPVKNHRLMFDVLELLKERGMQASLSLIGTPATSADVSYERALKEEAKARGLAVEWRGALAHTEVAPALCDSGIFINCSGTGSLDKAVLEAMDAGVPVVTSNEGLRSALAAVDPDAVVEATPAALAARITGILDLPEEAIAALRSRYREYVRVEHSLDRLIIRIIERLRT